MRSLCFWGTCGLLGLLLPCLAQADLLEDVICVRSGTVSVRTDNLRDVIADLPTMTPIKVFQDWGFDTVSGVVRGQRHDFTRVQVDLDNDSIEGWVAQSYIKSASECQPPPRQRVARPNQTTTPDRSIRGTGRGLDNPNCCVFPLTVRPKQSYLNGGRNFGASRGGGRKHAAADLKHSNGVIVRAITDGVVTLPYYKFYKGYNALEVTHTDGVVVRYGENNSFRAPGVRKGAYVSKGQTIAKMGLMLHIEFYTGKEKGSLTNREKPYSRRSDLMDPTPYLRRWEAAL